MEFIQIAQIKELAQDFQNAPRVSRGEDELSIVYDYEKDDGTYDEKGIYFTDVLDFRRPPDEYLTPEIIHAAYNSVAKVIDSDWLNEEQKKQGYQHFTIFFEDHGVYEVIAKNFRMDNIGYQPSKRKIRKIESNLKNLGLFTIGCALINLLLGLINPIWIFFSGVFISSILLIRIYEDEKRTLQQSDLLFFGSIIVMESITILLLSVISSLIPAMNLEAAKMIAQYSPLLYGLLLWLSKRKPKVLKTIFFAMLSLVGIVVISGAIFLTHERIQTNRANARIAAEFQIEASSGAVWNYLSQEAFEPGMSRKEIHAVLDRIGTWEVRRYDDPNSSEGQWDSEMQQHVFKENIRFTERYIYNCVGSWSFLYDKDGNLVDWFYLDSGG